MPGRTAWLASYPKSGNTWFRAVFTAMVTQAEPDINRLTGGPQAADAVTIERALGIPLLSLTAEEIQILRPRVDEVVDRESSERLLRKIHDALHLGPAGELIVSRGVTQGAIYIVRDPRDVAVSFAHHQGVDLDRASRLLQGWVPHDRQPASDPVAGQTARPATIGAPTVSQHLGNWSDHVVSWVDGAPFPVCAVRYEDCLSDPERAFDDAFRSIGLEFTSADLARAIEAASFQRLRSQEQASGFNERVGDAPFFRAGRKGGWRKQLPAAEAARIEQEHGAVMSRFGYL